MPFYEISLGALVVLNAALLARQHLKQQRTPAITQNDNIEKANVSAEDAQTQKRKFMITYLTAYLLATAADWLQGPHIYALYRYDKRLKETTTAALYASGFISGAISSTFVGQLTDKHGRKAACIVYCVSYIVCCATMMSDNLPILFLGRVFGGIGTTLLFTSFESWMMTEYHSRNLDAAGLSTATIFGKQTTLNSVVAIFSGVIGEALVNMTGTRKAPFVFAGLISALCACWIVLKWPENHGGRTDARAESNNNGLWPAIMTIVNDVNVSALTIASCAFESMMYLFVFFWTSAITSARASAKVTENPPYGLIFACFMCAMMAGSQVFGMMSISYDIRTASSVLEVAMTCASMALMASVVSRREGVAFWSFCVVEFCVGLYFPSMSYLKGRLVKDESRAKLYSLMRVPLNGFVLTAHAFAEEGDHHRNLIFLIFGAGILLAFVVVRRSIM